MNRDIIAFTKYKFNVYGNKDIRSGKDSAVVGIVGKSKSLQFLTYTSVLYLYHFLIIIVKNAYRGDYYKVSKRDN